MTREAEMIEQQQVTKEMLKYMLYPPDPREEQPQRPQQRPQPSPQQLHREALPQTTVRSGPSTIGREIRQKIKSC